MDASSHTRLLLTNRSALFQHSWSYAFLKFDYDIDSIVVPQNTVVVLSQWSAYRLKLEALIVIMKAIDKIYVFRLHDCWFAKNDTTHSLSHRRRRWWRRRQRYHLLFQKQNFLSKNAVNTTHLEMHGCNRRYLSQLLQNQRYCYRSVNDQF